MEDVGNTVARFEARGRQVIMIEQTTPLQGPLPDDFLPSVVRVRFPHLQIQSWWQSADRGLSSARRQRLLEFDLAGMLRSEQAAGLDGSLVNYIRASMPRRPLFWMPVHPDADLLGRLYEIICAKLRDLSPMLAHCGATAKASELLDFYSDHPVRQEVASALSLEWAEADWYRLWSEGVTALNDQVWGVSIDRHERALDVADHDGHVWHSYGKALEGGGYRDKAHAAFSIAHRRFPRNVGYGWDWLRTLSDNDLAPDTEPLLAQLGEIYDPYGKR